MTQDKTRRRDAGRTKADILRAAQQAFADLGYAQAGLRHIAAQAGIDPALVLRYFGSKAGLFEAALIDAIPRFAGLDLAHAGFGERVVARYLDSVDMRSQAMIVLAMSDPDARAISIKVMEEQALKPLADWLGTPDARTRAVRMTMLSTGFMLYTWQIQLMTPGEAVDSRTADWLADALQAVIDGN